MATVTLDARWLIGGIGTYTKHLLAGLCAFSNGFEIQAITRPQHLDTVKQSCSRVKVVDLPIYTVREQFAIPRAANGCDLLHVPHYNAPLLYHGRLIVSILDLGHITDPAYNTSPKSWLYARPMLKLVAHKAQHIVTISEYSKTQIVEQLGVPDSKVKVIYCGVNRRFSGLTRESAQEALRAELRIQAPYVLYVGNLKPHKNVSTLLRAFRLLRERHPIPHKLLIVGDDLRWKKTLVSECVQLGLADVAHFIPRVEEQFLPKIYAAADLLVMPSRSEGFGLPVLEAMASGTPVVCSRAASLPEVGGDAVIYFDPSRSDELAHAIETVLSSPELQRTLRARGLERAKQFTWEESTRKHLELYTHVLS